MPTQKEKKVSEKSTKLELWTAYNEVVAQISGEEIAVQSDDSVNDAIKKLSETKININGQFDQITKTLLSDLSDLYKTSEQIRQNKEDLIKFFENQKKDLQNQMEEVKKKWTFEEKRLQDDFQQKKNDQETKRQREEEEHKYNLSISRKKENDQYQIEKERQDRILKEREKEIATMEKQVAEMPTLIAVKIKEAEENLTKDLSAKYQLQIKELAVSRENEAKIAEIKIANMETIIKNQAEEISGLKSELSKVNAMIKEMAVSAIEAKKPAIMSAKHSDEN